MKIIAFDVIGDFAFFRNPEGTRTNYSFPFPPRTAVIGMIAAILGKPRNQYWLEPKFRDLKIGIQLLKYPKNMPLKVNYWQTKSGKLVNIKIGKKTSVSFLMPKDPESYRGYTTQFKLEYLQDVYYRIYVLPTEQHLQEQLIQRLENKKYYYPPILGHNNLLAQIEYIGAYEFKEITTGEYQTIIPTNAINLEKLSIEEFENVKLFYRVPNAYKVTQEKQEDETYYVPTPSEYVDLLLINPEQPNNKFKIELKPGYGYRINKQNETIDVCLFSSNN